eukprot:743184-Hanusia_phi.AAC.1
MRRRAARAQMTAYRPAGDLALGRAGVPISAKIRLINSLLLTRKRDMHAESLPSLALNSCSTVSTEAYGLNPT